MFVEPITAYSTKKKRIRPSLQTIVQCLAEGQFDKLSNQAKGSHSV